MFRVAEEITAGAPFKHLFPRIAFSCQDTFPHLDNWPPVYGDEPRADDPGLNVLATSATIAA